MISSSCSFRRYRGRRGDCDGPRRRDAHLREMDLPPVDTLQLLGAMANEMITRTPKESNHVFRQHLLLSARRGHAEHEAELSRIAIAFVDLTDSTRWPNRFPAPATRPRSRGLKMRPGRQLRRGEPGWSN